MYVSVESFSGLFTVFFMVFVFICLRYIKKYNDLQTIPCWVIPSIIFLYILLPIAIIILCISTVYRLIICTILKIRYGSKFGGLLKGPDAFHMATEKSDNIINSVIMFQCTEEINSERFYNNIRQVVFNMQQRTKFNSRFLEFYGYNYMLKETVTTDDCLKRMKNVDCESGDKISQGEFLKLLNEYFNLDLPDDNTVPWEVIVGQQPVKWRNDEHTYFPLLFRANHALADGVTLLQVMVNMLSDDADQVIPEQPNLFRKYSTFTKIKEILKAPFVYLYMFLLIPATFATIFMIKGREYSILKKSQLKRKRFFAFYTENSPSILSKIRNIKCKIPGASFTDVVLTGFGSAIKTYCDTRGTRNQQVSVAVPVLFGSSGGYRINPEKIVYVKDTNINNMEISNKHAFVISKVPVHISHSTSEINDIFNRFAAVKRESKIYKQSFDYQMMLLFTTVVCAVLPQRMIKALLQLVMFSAVINILPGPQKIYCWNRSAFISDVIAFSPNKCDSSATLTLNTYDGRVQIGVSVDKAIMPDKYDVEDLAKNFIAHIQSLDTDIETLERCNMLDEVLATYPFT